jgi:hypothetical protein
MLDVVLVVFYFFYLSFRFAQGELHDKRNRDCFIMKSKIQKVKTTIKTLPLEIKFTMKRTIPELLFRKIPSEFINIVKYTWTQI